MFDVARADLSGASHEGGVVLLRLSPCKAVEFHRLTQSHIGRALLVRLEGVPVLRAHISAAIQSGRIVFNSTDEHVLSKLAGVARPQPEAGSGALDCAAAPSGVLDGAARRTVSAFQMRSRPVKYYGSPNAETAAILR